METSIIIALVAGGVTAIGWLANHWLSGRREEGRRRVEAQLKFVERQIEELYGPLVFLIYEGRRTFADLLDTLGQNFVFPLPGEEELGTWLFWAEAEFLPRNEKIKSLLMLKSHLIEGPRFPQSYVTFLDHANSWAINHLRWKEQGVEYSWHSKINWPYEFETEIIATFEKLKSLHSSLVGRLS